MKNLKKSLLFTLSLLPIAAVAGYFTILYQLEFLDAATVELAVSQLGSVEAMVVVYVVQTVCYAAFCGFVGHILASKLGLMRPIGFERRAVVTTLVLSVIGGILFSLDYWTFGAVIPGIQEENAAMLNWTTVAACVLYGGVVEELMLRLFFMSLIAWLIWKLFCRKQTDVPAWVLAAANVIAAVCFAAGHLPATVQLFGTLTPLIIVRCFLLNGGFGLLLGWLYRRYGIQYAMLSHALLHVVSKAIWFVFV